MHWLVLETLAPAPLQYHLVAIFCDNAAAVLWTLRLGSSTSPLAAHLLRALALRLHIHKAKAAPLLCWPIIGQKNAMADAASRSFSEPSFTNADNTFLQTFSHQFPLTQPHSWKEHHLHSNVTHARHPCCLGNHWSWGGGFEFQIKTKILGSLDSIHRRLQLGPISAKTIQTPTEYYHYSICSASSVWRSWA